MKKLDKFLIIAGIAAGALTAGLYVGTHKEARSAPPSIAPENLTRLFAARLIDVHGTQQHFAQWQDKTLVINFWATWCPPCRDEMPSFSRLNEKYAPNGVQFVGIALDSAENVSAHARQFPVSYPLLIGGPDAGELAQQLGNPLLALPYTLILSPGGHPVHASLGMLSEAELENLLPKNRMR